MKHTELNDMMEFGHVVRVLSDGTFRDTDAHGLFAPELRFPTYPDGSYKPNGDRVIMEQAKDQWWELLTWYTGQYGYNGPVMHASEYVGGDLARNILAQPGMYVACLVYPDTFAEADGWCVAYREA